MGFLLFAAFLVVPIAELAVLIQVGQAIGVADTIVLLIVVSAVGAWLVKRAGISVMLRMRQQMEAGRVPGKELIDAFLILFAGVLMLTPGFLTDCLAILLLIPPVRAAVRGVLRRRFEHRIIIR